LSQAETEPGLAGLVEGVSPSRRILVVDDNLHSAQTLELLLRNERYQVLALSNSTKAAELARQFAPHIALLDLAMPVMDGFALCSFFRQWPWGKRMHIIAVTGRDFDEARMKAAGFDAWYLKPLDWPVLKGVLASVPTDN